MINTRRNRGIAQELNQMDKKKIKNIDEVGDGQTLISDDFINTPLDENATYEGKGMSGGISPIIPVILATIAPAIIPIIVDTVKKIIGNGISGGQSLGLSGGQTGPKYIKPMLANGRVARAGAMKYDKKNNMDKVEGGAMKLGGAKLTAKKMLDMLKKKEGGANYLYASGKSGGVKRGRRTLMGGASMDLVRESAVPPSQNLPSSSFSGMGMRKKKGGCDCSDDADMIIIPVGEGRPKGSKNKPKRGPTEALPKALVEKQVSRGQLIKKIMAERGVNLGRASQIIREEKLMQN